MAPNRFGGQGPDAPLAHHRSDYPLSGCVPAEPGSASPDKDSIVGRKDGKKMHPVGLSGKMDLRSHPSTETPQDATEDYPQSG